MKLIVGLGNPGKEYQNNRHNLGSNLILKICSQLQLTLKNDSKLSSQILKIGDVILAIPNTYMNLSGQAVQAIASYYKIIPENIYVIHDDLDLEVGDYRLQFDRGPAGHNGIKSIIDHLNTQAFHRIRIGVGHPQNLVPVDAYVLQPFSSDEKRLIDQTTDKISSEVITQHLGH